MEATSKSGHLIAAAAAALLLSGSVAARPLEHAGATSTFVEANGCGGFGSGGGSPPQSDSEARVAKQEKLVQRAKGGDAKIQNELGMRYEQGVDVAQSNSKAAEWYRAAAQLGYAEAQFNLARLCYNGIGMAPDYVQAANWFEKAAQQGHGPSVSILGVLYAKGDKLPQDLEKAARWTAQDAALGNAAAQYQLGVFHLNGQGVKKDMLEAYKWFAIAEANGNTSAGNPRKAIEPNLTSEEIAAVQTQVRASKQDKPQKSAAL